MVKKLASLATAALVVAYAIRTDAAPPEDDRRHAEARTLFYEARDLMKGNQYALACPKLEESLRLNHGLGTEFNLAVCYEKTGKLAAAWRGFSRVAKEAKAKGQHQRERVARERALALEPRLPRLVLHVGHPSPPGLVVEVDGESIESTEWGTPSPIDPGRHHVSAETPDRREWEASFDATEGTITHLTIPAASHLPSAAAQPTPSPNDARADHDARSTPFTPHTTARTADTSNGVKRPTQRTVGWILGGLGLAGLGVGAGFGLDSLRQRERAMNHCVGDLCSQRGVDLRDDAIRSGNIATLAGATSAVALVGAAVLLLTAPRNASSSTTTGGWRASPRIARDGGSLQLVGPLP